jgi:hypothetical protein
MIKKQNEKNQTSKKNALSFNGRRLGVTVPQARKFIEKVLGRKFSVPFPTTLATNELELITEHII